jgi:serine/threonine-protein kinase
MPTTSSKTTTSIRFLPKWAWWVAIAYIAITIITYIGALPIRYNQLLQIHTQTLAIIQLSIEYLLVVVVSTLGLLLVLRRPNERIAVLTGVTLVAGSPNFTALSHLSTQLHPIFYIPSGIVFIFIVSLIFLFIISAPDGIPQPRWMIWLIPPFLVFDTFRYLVFFVFGSPEIQALRPAVFVINMTFLFMSLLVMVRRYQHRATAIQRQQFKWMFLGVTISLSLLGILQTFRIVAIRFGDPNPLNSLFASIILTSAGIIICSALVLSITRYGLWDVDLTLNRSAVATIVTISLVIVFGGIFSLTQTLLRGILGTEQSEIAVTISAVVAGIAFNPVRLRARTFVDRRLYGFRFDLNQLQRHKEKADVITPGALTGQILGGYELLDVIGRGGMGEVYKGYADGQYVAIKILQTMHTNDDIMRQRFMREGKIALAHKNIVQTLGAGEENGVFFILIEYVDGQTLKELLTERQYLALSELKTYLHDLAGAIDYAHAQGYVHRDIKPSNIMLRLRDDNETYDAILMDFGIAKFLDDTGSLTGSAAVGTIDYMAPEQIMDSTTVDYRADIYALGVVIYHLLTGALPFKGTLAQVLFAHINQPAPDIRQIRPDMSLEVSFALQRALQKDPNDRFQSATEFVNALTSGL